MRTIYDEVRAGRHRALDPSYEEMVGGPPALSEDPAGIRADEVARFFFETPRHVDQDIDDLAPFPALLPPFPETWVETAAPPRVRLGNDEVAWPDGAPNAWAADFKTVDLRRDGDARGTHGGEARWSVSGAWYARGLGDDRRGVVGPVGASWLRLDEAGRPVATGDGQPAHKRVIHAVEDEGIAGWAGEYFADALLLPVYLAVAFLHCKNVTTVEEPVSRQERRERQRRKEPGIRFHTLRIEPMTEVLRREGRSDEVGLAHALHICRGHFATYTEEKPLFGKATGTFWRPDHVRGNAARGAVLKDYDVRAPRPRR